MPAKHTEHNEILEYLHSVADFIRWGASELDAAGVHFGHGTDNAFDEAAMLVLHSLHLPLDLAAPYLAARLLPAEKEKLCKLVRQRIELRKPAAYLIQQAWFMGLPFFVDERVLIPRSPFAELIEQQFAPWLTDPGQINTILDIGTGSGCIGIACAYAFPQARVDLVDISAAALAVARHNIELHGLQQRVSALQSDLFSALAARRYDLIVSNPPYVGIAELAQLPPEYRFEPELGLVAGERGLDCVLKILHQAGDYLTENGLLIVEVGASAAALTAALPQLPFTWLELERGGEGVFLFSAEQLHDYFARS